VAKDTRSTARRKKTSQQLLGETFDRAKANGLKRGMTEARYRAALRMVHAGETTWDALEKAGIATPRRHGKEAQEKQAIQKALKRVKK